MKTLLRARRQKAAMLVLGVLASLATHPVQAQQAMMTAPDFIVTTPSNYSFDDTLDLLKGAIEKVMVRFVKPSYLFDRYEGLGEIGQELETLVRGIMANVQN